MDVICIEVYFYVQMWMVPAVNHSEQNRKKKIMEYWNACCAIAHSGPYKQWLRDVSNLGVFIICVIK